MNEPIISVSGLRGIVGQSLTPEVALRYACAFAAGLPPGPILLTRDGRGSGRLLADLLRSALAALGRDVIDAGVAPTPTHGVLVRELACAGGVQISASHNPPPWNGLKLLSAEGRVISAAAGADVLERYRRAEFAWAAYDALGKTLAGPDPAAAHVARVLDTVDADRIRRRRFRVLLDANHGAGSVVGVPLLRQLGCEAIVLGGQADGAFAHPPEPIAENLLGVAEEVRRHGADAGFCQDPDADRLALIDEQGCPLGEEATLALCVAQVLRTRRGPVVVNGSTSRMTEDLCRAAGVPLYRTAVGEANVVERMLREGAVFGGEGNGGPIDPRVVLIRDSFVGMAQVLAAMAERELPLSRLADELPRYEIVKTKLPFPPQRLPAALDALARRFADAAADRGDGLRLAWPAAWLQVRGSNTEPIVRIIAEAETLDAARTLCDEAAQVLAAAGR